jgi:hypothetical protein
MINERSRGCDWMTTSICCISVTFGHDDPFRTQPSTAEADDADWLTHRHAVQTVHVAGRVARNLHVAPRAGTKCHHRGQPGNMPASRMAVSVQHVSSGHRMRQHGRGIRGWCGLWHGCGGRWWRFRHACSQDCFLGGIQHCTDRIPFGPTRSISEVVAIAYRIAATFHQVSSYTGGYILLGVSAENTRADGPEIRQKEGPPKRASRSSCCLT